MMNRRLLIGIVLNVLLVVNLLAQLVRPVMAQDNENDCQKPVDGNDEGGRKAFCRCQDDKGGMDDATKEYCKPASSAGSNAGMGR